MENNHPFIPFHKIPNFKNAKNDISEHPIIDKTLHFTGTVKLHGTHGDVVRFSDGHVNIQSRNRILRLDGDNNEFAAYIIGNKDIFTSIFDKIILIHGLPQNYIMISGEWCGGSIQKKVALSKLPRMFVIFGIRIDNLWLDMELFRNIYDETGYVYNIYQFRTYSIEIDFENSSDAEMLMTKYTNEIEKECPVGKYFGISGIGEGIVWKTKGLSFKTKGELMSHTKSMKIPEVRDLSQESIIDDFVYNHLTENRLNQGIEYLNEFNIEISTVNTNTFRKWIEKDIITEEDYTLKKIKLTPEEYKILQKKINNHSSKWFLQYVKKEC